MRASTLIGTSLGAAGAAVVGSIASRQGIESWYPALRKPGYVPPNGVFPVAWTSLYTAIAATSASTIDRMTDTGDTDGRRSYRWALASNLALNASWSWLFFKAHKLGPSAVAAAALTVSSADLARRTTRVNPVAGLALLPYPAWCAFATIMTADIWRLNRRRAAVR